MSMVEVDELKLERVRTWVMYMEAVFPPRNEQEMSARDDMREDWNDLYEGINKLSTREIKVIKT